MNALVSACFRVSSDRTNFYGLHFKPAVRAVLPDHLHGLGFHDLRHTYASLLVEQGAHPKEMAELLGHSSVQITLDRYSPRHAAHGGARWPSVWRPSLAPPIRDRPRTQSSGL